MLDTKLQTNLIERCNKSISNGLGDDVLFYETPGLWNGWWYFRFRKNQLKLKTITISQFLSVIQDPNHTLFEKYMKLGDMSFRRFGEISSEYLTLGDYIFHKVPKKCYLSDDDSMPIYDRLETLKYAKLSKYENIISECKIDKEALCDYTETGHKTKGEAFSIHIKVKKGYYVSICKVNKKLEKDYWDYY